MKNLLHFLAIALVFTPVTALAQTYGAFPYSSGNYAVSFFAPGLLPSIDSIPWILLNFACFSALIDVLFNLHNLRINVTKSVQ